MKKEISCSECKRTPVSKFGCNENDSAVYRSILGGPEVLRCKYSRGTPGILECSPVQVSEIVIAYEIGLRQPEIWDTHEEKDEEQCEEAPRGLTS